MKGNIDAIRALSLSTGAKERILGGNAARLLKRP
jgi:predicted TIM-barrel fold metal-dependent hydrolase